MLGDLSNQTQSTYRNLSELELKIGFYFFVLDNDVPTENNVDLHVQNENLLHIIHQMREDMEDLTKQLSQRSTGSGTGVPITEGLLYLINTRINDVKIPQTIKNMILQDG